MKTREDYAKFLESDFWIKLSLACRARAKFICYRCGKRAGKKHCQAHHVRYPDDWYQTTLDDLICLCRKCHEREHHVREPRPEPMHEPEYVPPPPDVPENIVKLQELYALRNARKITRREFVEQRRSLGGGPNDRRLLRQWRVKKPKHKKHHRPPKPRAPQFGNSMKGMIWCRPYRHWVNRGTSSN